MFIPRAQEAFPILMEMPRDAERGPLESADKDPPVVAAPTDFSAGKIRRNSPAPASWKSQTGLVPRPQCVSTKPSPKSSQEFGSTSGKPAPSSARCSVTAGALSALQAPKCALINLLH